MGLFWWNRVVSGVAMSGDFSHIKKKEKDGVSIEKVRINEIRI